MILATVNRSVAGSKTKTLNSAQTKSVSSQSEIESGTINIGKQIYLKLIMFICQLILVQTLLHSDTDITDRFDLDNGQRDNFYDIGRIKLKSGQVV